MRKQREKKSSRTTTTKKEDGILNSEISAECQKFFSQKWHLSLFWIIFKSQARIPLALIGVTSKSLRIKIKAAVMWINDKHRHVGGCFAQQGWRGSENCSTSISYSSAPRGIISTPARFPAPSVATRVRLGAYRLLLSYKHWLTLMLHSEMSLSGQSESERTRTRDRAQINRISEL